MCLGSHLSSEKCENIKIVFSKAVKIGNSKNGMSLSGGKQLNDSLNFKRKVNWFSFIPFSFAMRYIFILSHLKKYIALCQCLSAIFFCVWQSAIFLAKKIQSAISKKVEELDLVDSIFGCKICWSIMSQSIVKKYDIFELRIDKNRCAVVK